MKKRRIKTYVILVLVFISIGVVYAALTTSFGISGTVNVSSATYNVTYTGSNATFSSSSSSIIFGSTTTNKITPVTGYYLKSLSCTNGYTTDATTGTSATAAQTVTISNNKNASNSACTATMSNIYTATIAGSSITSSPSILNIPYNGSASTTITPAEGHYFQNSSCTTGYSITGLVEGKGNITAQTVTINNNSTAKDGTCNFYMSDTYFMSMSGSHATFTSPSMGQIAYGTSSTIVITPETGYFLSGISCTNGYTASAKMGPNISGSSVQNITINNNKNAADTKCTVTMSNSYGVILYGTNVTYNPTSLTLTYGTSKTVNLTPKSGYYLKSFTCQDGYTHNAKTGTSATGTQTITIKNNIASMGSCTATAEPLPECDYEIGQTWTYTYNSNNQGSKQFSVPCAGNYKLEVTSGRGGKPYHVGWTARTEGVYECATYPASSETVSYGSDYYPGKVSGEFYFDKGQTLYVVPGGNGGSGYEYSSDASANGCGSNKKGSGGYNGGLAGTAATVSGSGGITHIALVDGLYDTVSGTSDLLLAAKSGGRYKYKNTYVASGAGSNYVNTSSSYYTGGITTTATVKENFGTAIITYLGP